MIPHKNYMKKWNNKTTYILTINIKPLPKIEEKY